MFTTWATSPERSGWPLLGAQNDMESLAISLTGSPTFQPGADASVIFCTIVVSEPCVSDESATTV